MVDRILSGVRRPASGVRRPASGVLAVLVTAGPVAAERPPIYEVVDLGRTGFVHDPDGRSWASGPSVAGTFDVNASGQVAYARVVPDDAGGELVQPWFFTLRADNGVAAGAHPILTTFGPDGETTGAALDINDDGVIVGQIQGSTLFEGVAHVWILHPSDPTQTITVTLPLPEGSTWSRAVSVSESAPWTVVVHTGREELCPSACANGTSAASEHVQSYAVTIDGTGAVSAPIWFSDDADCFPTVTAWAAGPLGAGFVGSDRQRSETSCGVPGGSGCGVDQSGLQWTAPGSVPGSLADFDAGGGDDNPSEGRDIAGDGLSVGFGVQSSGECFDRALLWDAAGSIGFELWSAPLDPADIGSDPKNPIVDPLDSRRATVAEGINDAAARLIVGWDGFLNRGVVWYPDVDGTGMPIWEAMFPGVNAPERSPGTIVAGVCTTEVGDADVEPSFLYDVNDDGVIVGRADFSGLPGGGAVEEEMHLVLLVPRGGCRQDGWSDFPDVDRDGDVDLQDLLAVLNAYGDACVPCEWCPADVNDDDVVDFDDMLEVLNLWTEDCETFPGPPDSVQECWQRSGGNVAAFAACLGALEQ